MTICNLAGDSCTMTFKVDVVLVVMHEQLLFLAVHKYAVVLMPDLSDKRLCLYRSLC